MQFAEQAYKKVMQSILDKYFSDEIECIVRTHVPVDKTTYPVLWNNYQECCNILNVECVPILFVTNQLRGINGLTLLYKGKTYIVVSPQVTKLPSAEQRFLLGHEVGHCLQENLAAHVIVGLLDTMRNVDKVITPIIQDLFDVPLKNWFRESEYKADEAGYRCCKDLEAVKGLLSRVGRIDCSSAYEQYKELEQMHPLGENRLKHLITYSNAL